MSYGLRQSRKTLPWTAVFYAPMDKIAVIIIADIFISLKIIFILSYIYKKRDHMIPFLLII